jgi:PKD repeat protein
MCRIRVALPILIIITLISISSIITLQDQVKGKPGTTLAIKTNKYEYYLREKVNIQGNLSSDGTPISNGLVALEIKGSMGSVAFRTIPTGNVTSIPTIIEIVDIVPCDSGYSNEKDVFYIQPYPKHTYAYFQMFFRNNDTISHNAVLTVSLYDGNTIPIGTRYIKLPISPGEHQWPVQIELPYWAYIGTAKILANIYTDYPSDGGIPYCLEKSAFIKLTRNTEFLEFQPEFPQESPPIEPDGTFNTTFRLSPEPFPGICSIHATARKDVTLVLIAIGGRTFEVNPTFSLDNSYPPSPPQASFTFIPLHPYKNQEITFDASGSSPEGLDDEIISYEWNFNDGTPSVTITNPTIIHTLPENRTYIVTLNVTDSEGLWSTTSKPVTVWPPDPPKAYFSWLTQPVANETATFDASQSEPGWNGTHEIPIVSYQWDFDDGNITTVSTATITHIYTDAGNYTVTLTVTDSSGLSNATSKIVNVLETAPPPLLGDVNRDGVVDGQDMQLVKNAIPSAPGSPNWNPNADLNEDGVVDGTDYQIVKANIGHHT